MLVFVSDMHMADNPAGDPVSDADLQGFLDELAQWVEAGPVTLVLLGDIIDFLRSPKWEELWRQHNSAPWSAMTADFSNFPGSYAESCLLEVQQGVKARYPQLSATLKALVDTGTLKIIYVPGNHDFMLQLSPSLREEVRQFLSLTNDPGRIFAPVYMDAEASVYATHGHTYDPVNYHLVPEGLWAFGDAIVLRLVNRFQSATGEALGLNPGTELGRRLADIDNVEPLSDVPIYVRWLSEQLTVANQRRRVLAVWKQTVNEVLALPEFLDDAYNDPQITAARTGLKLSTQLGLAELVVHFSALFPDLGTDYSQAAAGLAGSLPYRFVVFGHTHDPAMIPLPVSVAGKPAYYVNTGSWRRIVSRPRGSAGPFVGTRARGRFIVNDGVGPDRYQLQREWQAT
jgi:UDP-2,3-diacylglucosamine pyrophosphatase LpxH